MVSGPPPKPSELKRKQGNPGKQKLPKLASVTALQPATAFAPAHLSEQSQQLWHKLRAEAFWISNTDESNLQFLCEKLDRRNEIIVKLAASDFVLYTDKG